MEQINGISFEDWACACANLANGMPEEAVIQVLGIELPVWQETNELWAGKLGDLMAEDMSLATTYGEYFSNPKQGKFSGSVSQEESLEKLLTIAPDYEGYYKISSHQSHASDVGIDPTTVLQDYGLTLGSWAKLNMHYMNWRNEFSDSASGTPLEKERFDYLSQVHNQWDTHWEAYYKNQKADLTGDIEF